jgi:adenylate kinase family enzyme
MEHPRRIVMEQPRRILLLGSPGSGKGRLVPIIAHKLGLPVVRLDHDQQRKARLKRSDPRWREELTALAADEFWVMTGHEAEVLEICVPRADWVIWLDLPISFCLRKMLGRLIRGDEKVEPGPEQPRPARWSSLRVAWRFPAIVVPSIIATIQRERRNRTIFILHSQPEVVQFIDKLPQAKI